MAATATLLIERREEAVLPVAEPVARQTYPYRYAGAADPHLSGQPCAIMAAPGTGTELEKYGVAFACGCREVVPGWTLSPV